jgi:hypothetical protein
MRKHGPRPRREHRSHPAAAERQPPVSDREYTSIEAVKATGLRGAFDRPRAEAERVHLPSGDDTVLARRELGESLTIWLTFPTVSVHNVRVIGHGGTIARWGARVVRET